LIDEIEALVAAGILNEGQANALIVKLENVIENLDKDKPKVALNNLNAFINQVQDFINEGVLTLEEGQPFIEATEAIIYQIRIRYQVD
jgi:hypothetical protein